LHFLGALSRRVGRLSPGLETRLLWMSWRGRDHALRVLEKMVDRGDVVIDIGAAEGLYAVRLSQLVGRRGRVYAFEPNPLNFRQLEAATVSRRNVSVHPVGLSDHAGEAELHIPVLDDEDRYGLGSISVPAARADVVHRVMPIMLERLHTVLSDELRPVAFIKCDVEGHELAVLRGGEETLRRSLPRLFVEIEQRHQDAEIQATFDYLARLGYAGYALHSDGLGPLEEFSVETDQLAFLGPRVRGDSAVRVCSQLPVRAADARRDPAVGRARRGLLEWACRSPAVGLPH
jgi:FkbM family methyltransferase